MRIKTGIVKSAKMQGTVTVRVDRRVSHPTYHKRYTVSSSFFADTGEFTDLKEGDSVEIKETKPMSKNKRWIVTKVLS